MRSIGRFVIDTHVHAQRHAFKFKTRGIKPDYATLAEGMPDVEVYDNTPRLLYDMDRYGVDMCVLIAAFGMTDDLDVEIIKKHPDRFVSLCNGSPYRAKIRRGEVEYSIEGVCEELDRQLCSGFFVGVGEGIPGDTNRRKPIPWEERFEEICQIMEVVRKHKVPIYTHTGTLSGYAGSSRGQLGARVFSERANPLLIHDVASAYPDVPIVLAHGGMQGWWSEMYLDACFQVVASHPNVYLETGLYWAKLYERPLRDPNIGVEKLIWGTDWGASIPQQWQPGLHPEVYANQSRRDGPPAHQVDYWGWQFKELCKLEIPQDDLNLILGGNAVRLFKLEDRMPHTRLFRQYLL